MLFSVQSGVRRLLAFLWLGHCCSIVRVLMRLVLKGFADFAFFPNLHVEFVFQCNHTLTLEVSGGLRLATSAPSWSWRCLALVLAYMLGRVLLHHQSEAFPLQLGEHFRSHLVVTF